MPVDSSLKEESALGVVLVVAFTSVKLLSWSMGCCAKENFDISKLLRDLGSMETTMSCMFESQSVLSDKVGATFSKE